MPYLFLGFLSVTLAGCASLPGGARHTKLETNIAQKDEEIERLRALLQEKENELKNKETLINELRKKLESFGSFE